MSNVNHIIESRLSGLIEASVILVLPKREWDFLKGFSSVPAPGTFIGRQDQWLEVDTEKLGEVLTKIYDSNKISPVPVFDRVFSVFSSDELFLFDAEYTNVSIVLETNTFDSAGGPMMGKVHIRFRHEATPQEYSESVHFQETQTMVLTELSSLSPEARVKALLGLVS